MINNEVKNSNSERIDVKCDAAINNDDRTLLSVVKSFFVSFDHFFKILGGILKGEKTSSSIDETDASGKHDITYISSQKTISERMHTLAHFLSSYFSRIDYSEVESVNETDSPLIPQHTRA